MHPCGKLLGQIAVRSEYAQLAILKWSTSSPDCPNDMD